MKLSLRIWFIAQVLNTVIGLIIFRELALLIAPFAFVGGLPAIGLYWFVIWLLRRGEISQVAVFGMLFITLPVCTALCAGLTGAFVGLETGEMKEFFIVPVAATVLSVLLHVRTILNCNSLKLRKNDH